MDMPPNIAAQGEMMMMPEVRIAKAEERAKLIQTLVLGFVTDPIARWIQKDASSYLAGMGPFFDGFGGRAFDHDSAFIANDGQAGALWLPPGVEPDSDAMDAAMGDTIDPALGADFGNMMEQVGECHPQEPHWYLPVIAADPAYIGLGLGGFTAMSQAENLLQVYKQARESNPDLRKTAADRDFAHASDGKPVNV